MLIIILLIKNIIILHHFPILHTVSTNSSKSIFPSLLASLSANISFTYSSNVYEFMYPCWFNMLTN